MKKIIIMGTLATILAGCVAMDKNVAIVQLQSDTARMMGLASSDELTISQVVLAEPDSFGNQRVTYQAKTQRGRVLNCSANLMAGLLTSGPSVSNPVCTPVNVHK